MNFLSNSQSSFASASIPSNEYAVALGTAFQGGNTALAPFQRLPTTFGGPANLQASQQTLLHPSNIVALDMLAALQNTYSHTSQPTQVYNIANTGVSAAYSILLAPENQALIASMVSLPTTTSPSSSMGTVLQSQNPTSLNDHATNSTTVRLSCA